LGILANPEAALASSGAGHVPSFRDTFIYWPNFIVFLGVMYFLLRKPFVDYWQTRAETIADALNAGRRAREEAQFELSQAESRYARVDEEVKGLIARIATESDAEAAKIVTDAEARARKITERAEQSRIAERNSLEIRLREELAESVVSEAQRILKNELSSASGEGREKDKALRAGALTGVSNILQ
ncbi:MAG: ATP synthase F0 subunit B, partial [Bdellovibrionales bacterium]|nr:ATP synthase F0 subunit B [Bdellovibrionales bacterium]